VVDCGLLIISNLFLEALAWLSFVLCRRFGVAVLTRHRFKGGLLLRKGRKRRTGGEGERGICIIILRGGEEKGKVKEVRKERGARGIKGER